MATTRSANMRAYHCVHRRNRRTGGESGRNGLNAKSGPNMLAGSFGEEQACDDIAKQDFHAKQQVRSKELARERAMCAFEANRCRRWNGRRAKRSPDGTRADWSAKLRIGLNLASPGNPRLSVRDLIGRRSDRTVACPPRFRIFSRTVLLHIHHEHQVRCCHLGRTEGRDLRARQRGKRHHEDDRRVGRTVLQEVSRVRLCASFLRLLWRFAVFTLCFLATRCGYPTEPDRLVFTVSDRNNERYLCGEACAWCLHEMNTNPEFKILQLFLADVPPARYISGGPWWVKKPSRVCRLEVPITRDRSRSGKRRRSVSPRRDVCVTKFTRTDVSDPYDRRQEIYWNTARRDMLRKYGGKKDN